MEAIIPLCKAVRSCVSTIRHHAKNAKLFLEDVQQTIDLFRAAVEPHIRIHQVVHGTQQLRDEPLGRIADELEDLLVEVLAYAEKKAKKYTVDISSGELTAFAKIRAKASRTASVLTNELGPLRKRSLKLYQERLRSIQLQIRSFMQAMISKSLFDLSLCVTKMEGKLLGCNETLSAEVNEISSCVQHSFCATETQKRESLAALDKTMEAFLSKVGDSHSLILQAKVTEEMDRLHKFQQEFRDHVIALQLQQEEDLKQHREPRAEEHAHKIAREKVAELLESPMWKKMHSRLQPGEYANVPEELLCPVLHRPMYDAVTVICEDWSCSTVMSEEALRLWVLKEKRATDINNALIGAVAVDPATRNRVECFLCFEQPSPEPPSLADSSDSLHELLQRLIFLRSGHVTQEMQEADRNSDNFVSWDEWKSYVGKRYPTQYRTLESSGTLTTLFGRSSDDTGLLAQEFETAILKLDVQNCDLPALPDHLLQYWLPSNVTVPQVMVDKAVMGTGECTAWSFDWMSKLVELLCRLGMQTTSTHYLCFLSAVLRIANAEGLPDELAQAAFAFVELVWHYIGEDKFSRAMLVDGLLEQLWQLVTRVPPSRANAHGCSELLLRYRRSALQNWPSPSLESVRSRKQCHVLRCLTALRLGVTIEDANVIESLAAVVVEDGDDGTTRVFHTFSGGKLMLKAVVHPEVSSEDCARSLRILSAMNEHGIYSLLEQCGTSTAEVSKLYNLPAPVPQEYVALMTRNVQHSLGKAFQVLLPVLTGSNASHREAASHALLAASKELNTKDSVKQLASISEEQSERITQVLGGADAQARVCMANGLAATNVTTDRAVLQALEKMLCSDDFADVSAAVSWLIPHYNSAVAHESVIREGPHDEKRQLVDLGSASPSRSICGANHKRGIADVGAMIRRVLPKLINILSEPPSPRRAEFCTMLRMFALVRTATAPFIWSNRQVLENFFHSGTASDEEQTAVLDAMCYTCGQGSSGFAREFVQSVVRKFLRATSEHQRFLAAYALGNMEDQGRPPQWGHDHQLAPKEYEAIAYVAARSSALPSRSWPFSIEVACRNAVMILRYYTVHHNMFRNILFTAAPSTDLGKVRERFLKDVVDQYRRMERKEQQRLEIEA